MLFCSIRFNFSKIESPLKMSFFLPFLAMRRISHLMTRNPDFGLTLPDAMISAASLAP